MQYSNVLHRLSEEPFAQAIQNYCRQGRWVLAKYTGLHLVSLETFSDAGNAAAALNADSAKRAPDTRVVLRAPQPPSLAELTDHHPAHVAAENC